MTQAVIFDLGNTLVSYFTRDEWPGVLAESIDEVRRLLDAETPRRIDPASLPDRVSAQRGEPSDHRFRPLEGRLAAIFDLPTDEAGRLAGPMVRAFMRPIFARAVLHDDVLPALDALRRRGLSLGILSNTPWGSPAWAWRSELARHRLDRAVDATVFCGDVGWRKPDRRPFERILGLLGAGPGEALFVGDDPRWDIAGPRGIGMPSLLIDRYGIMESWDEGAPLTDLCDLAERFAP